MHTTAADTTDPAATDPAATEADEAKNTADLLDAIREVLTMPRPNAEQRQKVRDQHQVLADTYPGEYVAYRDVWDGLTFVRREVLAHSPDLKDYFAQLGGYSDTEKGDIRVTYCEPLELRGKIVLRQRLVLPDAPE